MAAPHKQFTHISKQMSRVLRHNPPQEMDASGYVALPVLLAQLRPPQVTEALVRQIVAADGKGRYQLDDSCSPPRIRAVQGHSILLAAPLLEAVRCAEHVALAVHVTSEEGWCGIQDSGELRAMRRTHIHFATEVWATPQAQLLGLCAAPTGPRARISGWPRIQHRSQWCAVVRGAAARGVCGADSKRCTA